VKLKLILSKGLTAQFDKMFVVCEEEYLGVERFLRIGQQFIERTFAFVDAQAELEVRVGDCIVSGRGGEDASRNIAAKGRLNCLCGEFKFTKSYPRKNHLGRSQSAR
jgi:hypothetical protein